MEEVPDSQPPATAHSIKDLQQMLQVRPLTTVSLNRGR